MIARAVALIALIGGVAHADPDQAAIEAGDANLASDGHRTGVNFAAAIGPGLMVGFGLQDSVGRGGALSLRLGHVADPRTVITLELQITAALHKLAINSDAASNTETNLLVGAQRYVNPSLWLRGAGGLGVYKADQVQLSNGQLGTQTIVGPAALFGLGIDLARFKSSTLGLEFAAALMVSGTGALLTTAADINLAFD